MSNRISIFIHTKLLSLFMIILSVSGLAAENSFAVDYCEDISIEQSGVSISANNGVIQINRSPFTLKYRAEIRDPSITLSLSPVLNQKLQGYGRANLLASAGDYMALYPNDVVLLDEFSIFDNAEGRKTFAELIGEGYGELVEKTVAETPELSLATSIPKAASGFILNNNDKSYDYLIQKINSVSIQNTTYSRLYLTYFNVIKNLPPPSDSTSGTGFLKVVNWGACTIVFK